MGLQSHFDLVVADPSNPIMILESHGYHWDEIYGESAVILDRPLTAEQAEELEALLLADNFNPVFDTLPHPNLDAPHGFIRFGNVYPEPDHVLRKRNVDGGEYKRDFNVSEYKRNQGLPSDEWLFPDRGRVV